MTNLDLKGLSVLNTRPESQSTCTTRAIECAGGAVFSVPTLLIMPPKHDWLHKLPALNTVDQAIFISANAVDFTFSRLAAAQLSWPATIKITAVGRATACALSKHTLGRVLTPEISTSEQVLALQHLQKITDQTILLFKGEGGRKLLETSLLQKQAKLTILSVYERRLPTHLGLAEQSWWQNRTVDIILFTSQQGMLNLFTLFAFDKPTQSWLKTLPCVVISPRLAQLAHEFGIKQVLVSELDRVPTTLQLFKEGLPYV